MKKKMRVKRFRESIESKRLSVFTLIWSVVLLYVVTVLQSSLVPYLKIGNAAFDLTFTAAIFLSIYTNEYYGAVYGVVMGAVFDMINDSRIPIMPLVFLILCSKCGSMFPGMKKGYFFRKFAALTVCSGIRYLITFLLEAGRNSTPLGFLLSTVLPGLLYTIVVSPIVLLLCSPAGKDHING